jgi:hypothetical protein
MSGEVTPEARQRLNDLRSALTSTINDFEALQALEVAGCNCCDCVMAMINIMERLLKR